MTCGVYVIRNSNSGREYVGSSVNVETRWKQHRVDLNGNRHHCHALQKAWKKHGANAFEFELLEACEEDRLRDREQFFVDQRVPEYNSVKIVDRPSDLCRQKAAEFCSKRERPSEERERVKSALRNYWTPERKLAHSEKMKKLTRRPMSEEHKSKIREAAKKRWADPENRAAQSRVAQRVNQQRWRKQS